MTDIVEQLRHCRAGSQALKRGQHPSLTDNAEPGTLAWVAAYALTGALIVSIGYGIYQKSFDAAGTGFIFGFLIGTFLCGIMPLLTWIYCAVRHFRIPPPEFWEKFPMGQKWMCALIIGWGLVYEFNHEYYSLKAYVQDNLLSTQTIAPKIDEKHPTRHERHSRHREVYQKHTDANLPLKNNWQWGMAWLLISMAIIETIRRLEKYRKSRKPQPKNTDDGLFRLWLGYSTGKLALLSHGAGLAPKQHIALSLEDAAQNILILGGIGSGKTTRAIHPFLIQLLDQGCGGLIFDIKGDFKKAVLTFSEQTQRPVIMVGPGHQKINLLAGLTPEIASSFLKSVFLLGGKSHGDGFWVDTATELCRNTLGVLSFLSAHYSLQGLYSYLFDIEYRTAIDTQIDELLPTLEERSARLLMSYWQYQERIFDKFDEKVKASVHATVAQVLSPFNHPELVEAFCSQSEAQVEMSAVLNGAVYLVSLPLSIWGLGGKVAYSLIKLRFYNVMQQRTMQPAWEQENPVFFMCDEFQEIVSASKDGLSDLNFWDKSRSSKTIGIISAQAVSSFYAAIGDRDIVHALLQNFRQKLCFRTEDTQTLNYFNYLTDKVEVIRKTYSHTTGTQSNPNSIFSSSSKSTTENTTFVDKAVLSPQLFRKLDPDYAVALLSVRGHSMDDVIWMMPVYV